MKKNSILLALIPSCSFFSFQHRKIFVNRTWTKNFLKIKCLKQSCLNLRHISYKCWGLINYTNFQHLLLLFPACLFYPARLFKLIKKIQACFFIPSYSFIRYFRAPFNLDMLSIWFGANLWNTKLFYTFTVICHAFHKPWTTKMNWTVDLFENFQNAVFLKISQIPSIGQLEMV